MRISSSFVIATLLLTGAGCTQTAQLAALPEPPNRDSENMVGELAITTQELQRSFVLNDFASCTLDISYPVMPSDSLPMNVQTEIDLFLTDFISAALGSSANLHTTSQLDQLADTYMTECEQQITTEYADASGAGEGLFTNLKHNVEIVYSVKLNQYHLLTLGLEEYSYNGGAHPTQRAEYISVDRGADKVLTLGDILKPEALESFLRGEKTELLDEHSDELYPESSSVFAAFIDPNSPQDSAKPATDYAAFDQFYLTPTSIITYYNPYDIAPYAAGPIFVETAYSEIKALISLDGPLVPILEKL